MKLKLRIRTIRGVPTWIAQYGDEVSMLGRVAEFSVGEIMDAWADYKLVGSGSAEHKGEAPGMLTLISIASTHTGLGRMA